MLEILNTLNIVVNIAITILALVGGCVLIVLFIKQIIK